MKNIENKIADKLIKISKVNLFENSRRREVVEVRSILVKILRDHVGMKYLKLKEFFYANDKPIDHSAIIYSYTMYDVYRKYNPDVENWYNVIVDALFDVDEAQNVYTKKNNLKNKIDILDEEHIDSMIEYADKVTKEEIET